MALNLLGVSSSTIVGSGRLWQMFRGEDKPLVGCLTLQLDRAEGLGALSA